MPKVDFRKEVVNVALAELSPGPELQPFVSAPFNAK